ncbi:hypothetical protein TGAM01_v205887 [Trichoderma gamsii]|uniref:NACHT-NTPase and P-loop NTPases N-terminal domain-containing protein n=1 Tax=Trichoderma gamsii TaxID=398673 RepID=A0A2P4ZLN3_9HYPO|nr:hypothetical protein TGAM01_v205887 [Trichoderma gamsii]PON25200.1 hypothetical protein TGAM01_v205887 [Trichoderma gamsii]
MAVTKSADPISNIVTAVQAAMSNYQIVQHDKRLGDTFHEAGRKLTLIDNALSTIQTKTQGDIAQAASTSLESCNITATSLETIFKKVSEAPIDERQQSYEAYIGPNGKSNLVEALAVKMMEHIRTLATECDMEKENERQLLVELQAEIKKLQDLKPSVPIEQKVANHFLNPGNGNQFNAAGGTQNNATGSGSQFSGVTFTGAVTF